MQNWRGKMIYAWFSCGAASAVAAKLAVEKYDNVKIINNPVKEEHPDNLRFLRDVQDWIGQEIEIYPNPKWPEASAKEVWEKRKFMASPYGAPCTVELKKNARQAYEAQNGKPNFHVLGFTLDEKDRFERFKRTEIKETLAPLIDSGYTKQACFDILLNAGIDLPAIYKDGFSNANCIGCVKASSPTYWNLVREKYPEIFQDRAKQSREIGAKLVKHKGKRIFLDELKVTDKARPLTAYHVECGIFCEERL